MKYEIEFSSRAVEDLRRFRAYERTMILDAIERHLRHEPCQISKSRIKKLERMIKPQYRLRVDEIRVFYDVHGKIVEVIAIMCKSETAQWLMDEGIVT